MAAYDVVLVNYIVKIRSASGVLNAAVSARKPLRGGPLRAVVENYQLGVFVDPDDVEAIVSGASKHVPCSATEPPATRYQLPATAPQALFLDSGRWTLGVIHMAPPADRVQQLMADLLGWISTSTIHPLVSSSVFHYELFAKPLKISLERVADF